MLDDDAKVADSMIADSDLLPAQCLLRSPEAPHEPCAMPGDEAEPLLDTNSGGSTLCARCEQFAQLKTVTDFSRWLRACGASRSLATKIAGHGWPRDPDEPVTAAPSPIIAAIKSMIVALKNERQQNGKQL